MGPIGALALLAGAGCDTPVEERMPIGNYYETAAAVAPAGNGATNAAATPVAGAMQQAMLATSNSESASKLSLDQAAVMGEESEVGIRYDSDFYEPLSPYGQWIFISPYGQCWRPTRTAYNWQPYGKGQWAYSDAGWYWQSSEPWGWATYHYGRWMYTANYGWIWVPLTTWGPSWVSWRQYNNYIGWAPLPPCNIDYFGEPAFWPNYYVYVPQSQFINPVTPTTVAPQPPPSSPPPTTLEPPLRAKIQRVASRAIYAIESHLLRVQSEGAVARNFPRLAIRAPAPDQHPAAAAAAGNMQQRPGQTGAAAMPPYARQQNVFAGNPDLQPASATKSSAALLNAGPSHDHPVRDAHEMQAKPSPISSFTTDRTPTFREEPIRSQPVQNAIINLQQDRAAALRSAAEQKAADEQARKGR